jgi:flagellar motor switch protein FliG
MRQVEEAQQRIVGIVRKLEEQGELVIQRGSDDVLV